MTKHAIQHTKRVTATLVAAYVVLVVLTALGTMFVSSHGNVSSAITLASSHQPESFTELYFINPSHLPQYSPATKRTVITFHIQNNADTARSYQYRVSLRSLSGTTVTTGNAEIAANSGTSIPYSFSIPRPNEQMTITVSLPGAGEYLTFRSQS